MNKPKNKIAVALWIAAGLYLVAKVVGVVLIFWTTASAFPGLSGTVISETIKHILTTANIVGEIDSAILGTAELVALGAIVELVDCIRCSKRRSDN